MLIIYIYIYANANLTYSKMLFLKFIKNLIKKQFTNGSNNRINIAINRLYLVQTIFSL
jgi:hypothetical protein